MMETEEAQPTNNMQRPKVEITIERLEGIVWSTSKAHRNKEELNKSVPFVTAAVDFSSTCPNTKGIDSCESYFAALSPEYQTKSRNNKHDNNNGAEIRKITTCKTHEMGGTTTTTTTTTITTIKSMPSMKYRDGEYPLIAKWYDESNQEKLSDTMTYFTTDENSNSNSNSNNLLGGGEGKPHLTFMLPSPHHYESGPQPSLFEALVSPCNSIRETAETSFETIRNHSHNMKSKGKKSKRIHKKQHHQNEVAADTFSTAAETTCSSENALLVSVSPLNQSPGEKLMNLGSLLDSSNSEDDDDDEPKHEDTTRRKLRHNDSSTSKDEVDIPPGLSSFKSKDIAASAIAAEPSSGVVGRIDDISKKAVAFTPLSWMACGDSSPEIIELRVRVIPEDSDDVFDETDPLPRPALPSSQDLEGVAHLVFLDQIMEEGTTVMDLPLKISHKAKPLDDRDRTILSTTPHIGDPDDYVRLGADAMLRVRVTTVLPAQENPHPNFPPEVHQTGTMKTNMIPEKQMPFYTRPLSMMFPMMEKILHVPTHLGGDNSSGEKGKDDHRKSSPQKTQGLAYDSFTRQFRSVIPEDISKKAETLYEDWKSYSETWTWQKTVKALSDAVTRRNSYMPDDEDDGDDEDDQNMDSQNLDSTSNSQTVLTIKTPTSRSCSSLSQSTTDSLFKDLDQ